jgi:hypothetical protein
MVDKGVQVDKGEEEGHEGNCFRGDKENPVNRTNSRFPDLKSASAVRMRTTALSSTRLHSIRATGRRGPKSPEANAIKDGHMKDVEM